MQKTIKQKDLVGLLDEHFAPNIVQNEYLINFVDPVKLVTHNRLDLAIKILYLQMKSYEDVSFANEIYENHIKAFTLGSFSEPGNLQKNTLENYIRDFADISKQIATSGFDRTKSLVPCSSGNNILNGAHRVASAYVAKVKVPTVSLDLDDDQYDYDFFLKRGMSRTDIETAVSNFIEIGENCYTALIWPSAKGKQKQLENLIPNIVYQSSISLNHQAAHNLLSQVYFEENWLGSRDDNFPGVRNKLVECFKTFDDLRVIVFQAESLEQVTLIKDKIRQLFEIGKHSVHISDTKQEAVRISRLLLNENALHFLKYANPVKFPSTAKRIEEFKLFINNNNIKADDILLDSGILLSLYGIRETNDTDYLCINNDIKHQVAQIDDHSEALDYHEANKNSLVLNNSFHFYYEDIKFISFSQLYKMKKNRAEQKDRNDLSLMEALVENNSMKKLYGIIKQKYYFGVVKTRQVLMQILRSIGLYKAVRSVYHFLKR